jgi:dipeptidyl aminopeptidase/acylaminoacyl peptidase
MASYVVLRDGQIIFSAAKANSRLGIWRGRENGRVDPLVEQAAKHVAVSLDETMLAWDGAEDQVGLFVRALSGGPIRRLTDNANDENPAFSPDGKQLYFTRTTDDGARVYAIPIAGGTPTAVSPPGVAAFAVAGNDGRLALVAYQDKHASVVVGPPSGPFTEVKLDDRPYRDVEFSADGSRLLTPSVSELVEVDLRNGASRTLWRSEGSDTLNDLVVSHTGELWALISSDDGDLFLVDGSFR